MLHHFDHLIEDVGPPLGHQPGIWPKHHLPATVVDRTEMLMNALHDRAVLTSESQTFVAGVAFFLQHRVRMCLLGQTVSQAHQDGFGAVIT
ncbi:MAG TPA: hypothetical protein DEQ73_04655 [Phycisphaerales bacterium]|nr:hypothetical protein [Phycisphaerales bacterium]